VVPAAVPLGFVSSTAVSQRLVAVPSRSGALFDLALAVAAFVASLALLSHGAPSRPGGDELDLIGVVLAACSTVPLIAWRRFPLGVFVVTAAASVLLAGPGYPLALALGPVVALYLLAASRERENLWTLRTTATVVGLFVAYLSAFGAAQGTGPGTELLHASLPWAVAWSAGERTRLRREHIAELRERARRAEREAERERLRGEREAERERLLAVAEERARIARDLHDSAGHAINVIAVRAGAARLRHHQDPDRSLIALEAIEEVARQTVEEIDHMVGTLRESGSGNGVVEAPAGLASLDTLIGRHAAAGLEVTLDVSGAPRPLSGAADQAAYRILQEALTNAARHGAGRVRIELAFGNATVELTVTNPVVVNGASRSGGGHGLIGMRERAILLGGDFDVDRANGTFRVRARIPYGGHRV
jgi:signal transduction histidine kinase